MLKLYKILYTLGVMLWIPSIIAYFVFPEFATLFRELLIIGVTSFGIAHVAGMKYYKDRYDEVCR
jgi:hypothetical protein